MRKTTPQQLAIDLLARSTCNVQVAAVLFDKHGIFSWGWNSSGADGLGMHAEHHAISRANKKRLQGASIAIAGRRKRTIVPSMPCASCTQRIFSVGIRVIHIQERVTGKWGQHFLYIEN